ncbi:MAG: T9SS type A sorting domain-containing protein, partial [Fibrobacter sp.]|uniref:T9SS type A sorting domain-containing protein n=1 Tax=Fibrobacter sp. TaxID=35828 RepID=UPI0025C2C4E5
EYDNYKAAVSKAPNGSSGDYPWAKFKQGGWGKTVDQETVLQSTAAIKLKFEGTAGTSGDFNIRQVGSLGKCSSCGSACGIGDVKTVVASSVKAQLSDRVLHFHGISSAKAEVTNLQGEVVKSAIVSSTMDLSGLDAGIYMVRIAGKNVNFAQKIVLK